MPLARIPAQQATSNLRRRTSLWPDGRVPTDRLDGVAKVAFSEGFNFSRSDRIMTIGSCFAREIEKHLNGLGFDLPMLSLKLHADERASTFANDLVNKYTVQSIANELNWAFGETKEPEPEDLFLEVGDGLWHDPQLVHNLTPVALARAIERRAMVREAFRALPQCRVVVITLGLAEAWFDHRIGLHLNGAPPSAALQRDPERFSLDLLEYAEILEGLEAIRTVIQRHGHADARMLVTVSPVPFKATFSGVDAIQANSYSKAVQRAAVEAFVRRHADVDYVPSYEIVTHSHRETAFERDNIHVTAATVAEIMNRVVERYVPELTVAPRIVKPAPPASRTAPRDKRDLQRDAKFLAAERRYEEAAVSYQSLIDDHAAKMQTAERGQLHLDYGVALLRVGRPVDGVCQLRGAVRLLPQNDRAWFKLGLGLGRLKLVDASTDALRRATDLSPQTAHYHSRLALSLALLGRKAEARACYRRALELDPRNPEALAALAGVS